MDKMNNQKDNKVLIHEAARDGRADEVESLLKVNPRLAWSRDEDDRLPIHWALSCSQDAVVQVLIQSKDFDPDVKDGSGWTPLMIAASLKDNEAMCKLLLSKGAEVNAKNSSGQTALHFCASKSNLEIARILLSHGATTKIKDKRGTSPLHRAAAIGSAPMLQLLLNNRSPLNSTDVDGLTSLHHEGHADCALLLLKNGAEGDKRDNQGHLAIDLAPDEKVRAYIRNSAEAEGFSSV